MDDLLRFPSAVERDPAIDAWLGAQRDDLRPLEQMEEPQSDGLQGHARACRVVDDVEVSGAHGSATDKLIRPHASCQARTGLPFISPPESTTLPLIAALDRTFASRSLHGHLGR